MDYKEAYEICKKENPSMKALNYVEYEDFFAFNLVPEKNTGAFANNSAYVVNKKDNEHGWMSSNYLDTLKPIKIELM